MSYSHNLPFHPSPPAHYRPIPRKHHLLNAHPLPADQSSRTSSNMTAQSPPPRPCVRSDMDCPRRCDRLDRSHPSLHNYLWTGNIALPELPLCLDHDLGRSRVSHLHRAFVWTFPNPLRRFRARANTWDTSATCIWARDPPPISVLLPSEHNNRGANSRSKVEPRPLGRSAEGSPSACCFSQETGPRQHQYPSHKTTTRNRPSLHLSPLTRTLLNRRQRRPSRQRSSAQAAKRCMRPFPLLPHEQRRVAHHTVALAMVVGCHAPRHTRLCDPQETQSRHGAPPTRSTIAFTGMDIPRASRP